MSIRSLDRVPRDVMERKHYEQLAAILCDGYEEAREVTMIADGLQELNANFARKKFLEAVYKRNDKAR